MRGTISATIRGHLAETALAAGGAAIALSLFTDSAAQAAAGVAFVVVGAVARALRIVERAVTDTTRERDRLQREQDAAQAHHLRYEAARGGLEREREYLCEQMARAEQAAAEYIAAEKERLQAMVAAEREALLTDLENRETALVKRGWAVGYDHGQRGLFVDVSSIGRGAVVIPMPLPALGSDAPAAGKGSGNLS